MIFANIMKDKKKLKKVRKKVRKKASYKYRFAIINDDSLKEKLSVKLSRLNIFAFLGGGVFISFFCTLFVITTTPLSEFVPGKAKKEVQKELIALSIKSDSLTQALNTQEVYLENLRNIIFGKKLTSPKTLEKPKNFENDISFKKSVEDSLLRVVVEQEDVGSIRLNNQTKSEVLMFFSPINGIIVDSFNIQKKHFGIDLVAKEKTRISSVLEGTVIVSHWTAETGHVIGIQHKNGYFSLYKHNSVLLKSVADFVRAGEHIAIIGNSGELSTGPHLHFELWYKGVPVDPKNYILF